MQWASRRLFGVVISDEAKKFLRLGLVFTLILGTYWTLRTLKNATFSSLIGAAFLPWAKTVSLICFIPILLGYTALVDRQTRTQLFYTLSAVYAVLTLLFAFLLTHPLIGQAAADVIAHRAGFALWGTQILGYSWYVFVESYGLLMVALFWGLASDTTKPEAASRGFYTVTALGQVGGVLAPFLVARLPRMLGFTTNAFAIAVCAVFIVCAAVGVWYFFKVTPPALLINAYNDSEHKSQEPKFFEGIKLLLKSRYLLGLFLVVSFFEIITTIFDLHFQTLAALKYQGIALAEFIGMYGSAVNAVTLLIVLLGASSLTRRLGISVALLCMPLFITVGIFGFVSCESLYFLFMLMVGSKAVNFALNVPAIKQLYIPTTYDVRFKTQAWIETGARGSEQLGSTFNMLLVPLQHRFGMLAGRARHVRLSCYISFALVVCWFVIAWYLGKRYNQAVKNNKVVC